MLLFMVRGSGLRQAERYKPCTETQILDWLHGYTMGSGENMTSMEGSRIRRSEKQKPWPVFGTSLSVTFLARGPMLTSHGKGIVAGERVCFLALNEARPISGSLIPRGTPN